VLVKVGPDLQDHLLANPGDAHIAVGFAVDHELLQVFGHLADEQVRRFGHVGVTAEHERRSFSVMAILLRVGATGARPCLSRMSKEVSILFDECQKTP